MTACLRPLEHRGTLDGAPFSDPGHYRSYGRPGEIDPNSPSMLQQPHLPPSGLYWVRHYRRRGLSLAGQEMVGAWCDEWAVARVERPRRQHGDAPCPGGDYHPGRLYMVGANSRECEGLDLSEAEWRTLRAPDA